MCLELGFLRSRGLLQNLLLFNRPQQHRFLNQEINRRLQRIKCLQLYPSSIPINSSAYSWHRPDKTWSWQWQSAITWDTKTGLFSCILVSSLFLKILTTGENKTREKRLFRMSVPRFMPRCSIGKLVTENWELASSYFDAEKKKGRAGKGPACATC